MYLGIILKYEFEAFLFTRPVPVSRSGDKILTHHLKIDQNAFVSMAMSPDREKVSIVLELVPSDFKVISRYSLIRKKNLTNDILSVLFS